MSDFKTFYKTHSGEKLQVELSQTLKRASSAGAPPGICAAVFILTASLDCIGPQLLRIIIKTNCTKFLSKGILATIEWSVCIDSPILFALTNGP